MATLLVMHNLRATIKKLDEKTTRLVWCFLARRQQTHTTQARGGDSVGLYILALFMLKDTHMMKRNLFLYCEA